VLEANSNSQNENVFKKKLYEHFGLAQSPKKNCSTRWNQRSRLQSLRDTDGDGQGMFAECQLVH